MAFFKIYCRLERHLEDDEPEQCREVSIQATPAILREIARFLEQSAATLEGQKAEFAHVHLQDSWKKWHSGFPDVIAISPPSN